MNAVFTHNPPLNASVLSVLYTAERATNRCLYVSFLLCVWVLSVCVCLCEMCLFCFTVLLLVSICFFPLVQEVCIFVSQSVYNFVCLVCMWFLTSEVFVCISESV